MGQKQQSTDGLSGSLGVDSKLPHLGETSHRNGTARPDSVVRVEDPQSDRGVHPKSFAITDEQGRLVGHVLTVDGATLDDAMDGVVLDAFSVPDALSRPWSNIDARVLWGEFYAASLRALADRAEGATLAAEQAEGLRRTLDTLKRS